MNLCTSYRLLLYTWRSLAVKIHMSYLGAVAVLWHIAHLCGQVTNGM